MGMTKRTWVLGALLWVLLLLGACGGGDEAFDLSIETTDYVFQNVPTEVPAGLIEITLDNQGAVSHEFALAEIGNTPLDQFFTDFAPVISEGGAFPEYLGAVMVPIEVAGGESATTSFTVTEGTYAIFCALTGDAAGTPAEGEEEAQGPPHFTLGMAQIIVVGSGEADAALPEADGSVTATDYAFEADIEAGDTVINFTNDGPNEVHFASVSVFPEGTTAEDAEAAFAALLEAPPDAPPPEGALLPEDIAFSGIASDGLGVQFEVPGGFESGRTYIFTCFISDRAGGPPHAIAYQMYEVFTVE
jgi:plastocyanin